MGWWASEGGKKKEKEKNDKFGIILRVKLYHDLKMVSHHHKDISLHCREIISENSNSFSYIKITII